MYLTVGYHAIVDARVYEKRGELVSRQAQAAQEGSNSLVATLDSSNSHERSFGAPGEQIYAVQYRKLRFNWFSSRHVDKAELERDNRWKVSLGLRGGDNRNVDDVLEAYLADGMEAKGGERVVSSDGMEEFIFDWNEEDEDEDEDEVMPWD